MTTAILMEIDCFSDRCCGECSGVDQDAKGRFDYCMFQGRDAPLLERDKLGDVQRNEECLAAERAARELREKATRANLRLEGLCAEIDALKAEEEKDELKDHKWLAALISCSFGSFWFGVVLSAVFLD